jgi:TolB protein
MRHLKTYLQILKIASFFLVILVGCRPSINSELPIPTALPSFPEPTSIPQSTSPPTPTLVQLTATPSFLRGKISFWALEKGTGSIYLYDLEAKALTQLTHTQDDFWYPASWSPDGRYLTFVTLDDGPANIYLVDTIEDTTISIIHSTAWDFSPAWSPDGERIAFHSTVAGNSDIYIFTLHTGEIINLTNHPDDDGGPVWSPDGKKILFGSSREDKINQLFVTDIDESNLKQVTFNESPYISSYAWSPDGSKIAFTYAEGILEDDNLYLIDADGSNPKKLTNEGKFVGDVGEAFSWSPDGSSIAFYLDLGNYNTETFVVDVVSSEITRLTHHRGGDYNPVWSLDGNWIAFVSTRDAGKNRSDSIYVIDVRREGEPIRIINNDWVIGPIFWIP